MKRHNGSFLKELFISILLILVLSLICLLFISNHYYRESMQENHKEKIENDSRLISEMIGNQIMTLQLHANTLGTDANIKNYLTRYISDSDNVLYYTEFGAYAIDRLNEIQLIFDSFLESSAFIAAGEVFSNFQFYTQHDRTAATAFIRTLYEEDTDRFMMILPEMTNPIFQPESSVIPIVFRYAAFDSSSPAFLVCFVSSAKLASFISDAYLSYFDGIAIRDQKGRMILSDGVSEEKAGRSSRYSIFQTKDELSGWSINVIRDNMPFLRSIRELYLIETILLCLILALAGGIITMLYRRFTEPLKALMEKMLDNSRNRQYQHFRYDGENEIGTLTHCYNEVIDEVGDLVMTLNEKIEELEEEKKQREWEEEQKRRAEIKALQAQINPHFLYNALNSIVWITTENGDEKATEFTLHLARYYHTGLSRGEEFITLRDEMGHGKDYLWLQSHRYSIEDYDFSLDPAIKEVLVPKLIIQPLIENAIYHGLKPSERKWRIIVRAAKAGDRIIISVYDNGVGIPPKRLQKLNSNLHDGIIDNKSGYGIYNVNSRIRLSYGQSYGLRIYSAEGCYTLSVLELPASRETDEHTDH